MSRLRSIPYAVLTASLFAAGGASAQSMSSIDSREAEQQQRIDNGIRDGSLTRHEAYQLERGEQRINNYEARARSDGAVTPYERQRLDGMLDRESRDIHRESTDGQRAGGWDRGDRDRGNHYGWDDRRGPDGRRDGWDRGDRNGWHAANTNQHGWNGGGWNGHTPGTQPTTPNGQPGGHQAWQHGQNGGQQGGWNGHAPGMQQAGPTQHAGWMNNSSGWNGGNRGQAPTQTQPQYQPRQAQAARPMPVAAAPQARATYAGGGWSYSRR